MARGPGSTINVFVVMPWTPFAFPHENDVQSAEIIGKISTCFAIVGVAIVVSLYAFAGDLAKLLARGSEYHVASNLIPVLIYTFLLYRMAVCRTDRYPAYRQDALGNGYHDCLTWSQSYGELRINSDIPVLHMHCCGPFSLRLC